MPPIKYRRDLWQLLMGLPGNAAEIGVAEGNFSRDMLSWPTWFPKLYLVDRWKHAPQQKGDASMPQEWHDKNLTSVHKKVASVNAARRVVFLRGDSADMALKVPHKSLALVYIDADHSFAGVMADIIAWLPKLVPGGVMAFHDYENRAYGVKEAVTTYAHQNHLTVHPIPEDKPEDAGAYFYREGNLC